MKVCVITYGCTFNKADSLAMEAELISKGHEVVVERRAEVVVVNSCGVKEATEQKILHKIASLKKAVVVAGCLGQANPELVRKASPNALIVGVSGEDRIAEAVELAGKGGMLSGAGPLVGAHVDGAIARIRICSGCLSACAFCQTKLARGRLESVPLVEVRREVEEAVALGAKEIQLTAQDAGCYGFDLKPRKTLSELLEAVARVKGDFRVRVGMANPQYFRGEWLSAFADEKIYKFLHLPLQSGSDKVLKAMRRRHSARDFVEAVRVFRSRFPGAMIATDVIVGYPTETEADFRKTVSVLEETRPDIVNVSKYSARPKTSAALLAQLPNGEVKRRSEELSALRRGIALENNSRFVGRSFEVLAVEKTGNGFLARTTDYRPVVLRKARVGGFSRVRVTGFGLSHLKAVPETI